MVIIITITVAIAIAIAVFNDRFRQTYWKITSFSRPLRRALAATTRPNRSFVTLLQVASFLPRVELVSGLTS